MRRMCSRRNHLVATVKKINNCFRERVYSWLSTFIDTKVKELNRSLPLPPLFHFSRVKTLRSYLVRAKVYPGERLLGSKKCI